MKIVAKNYPDIEIVLGVGALNSGLSGQMANVLGIPKTFVETVYSDIMGKDAFSLVPVLMVFIRINNLQLKLM